MKTQQKPDQQGHHPGIHGEVMDPEDHITMQELRLMFPEGLPQPVARMLMPQQHGQITNADMRHILTLIVMGLNSMKAGVH